jgi:hypothetical protein
VGASRGNQGLDILLRVCVRVNASALECLSARFL